MRTLEELQWAGARLREFISVEQDSWQRQRLQANLADVVILEEFLLSGVSLDALSQEQRNRLEVAERSEPEAARTIAQGVVASAGGGSGSALAGASSRRGAVAAGVGLGGVLVVGAVILLLVMGRRR